MKYLVIAGPTAVGKTSLALHLHNIFPSLLISADSRQVYKHSRIVVGQDNPPHINIVGLDFLSPNKQVSVALWLKEVYPFIIKTIQENHLPIIVGGTGFYIHALIHGIDTLFIPPNPQLRRRLSHQSVAQLQTLLKKVAPLQFNKLNHSDKNNPLRLIRAIEVATSSPSSPSFSFQPLGRSHLLLILLKPTSLEAHRHLIRQRVIRRLQAGALQETQHLLQLVGPQAPIFTALGYRHLLAYLNHQITYQQLIDNWTRDEFKYAKNQLAWFKKTSPDYTFTPPYSLHTIAKQVKNWYHNSK